MKRLLLIIFFFQQGLALAEDDFKIQCEYSLKNGPKVLILLRPFRDTPTGSYIKDFEIVIKNKYFKFSGSDFSLATMKWDDPNKLHLGVLLENDTYKLNFIHVGPTNVRDYFSFLDIYKAIGPLMPGRYKPLGICW
jgi:hypothetical protein